MIKRNSGFTHLTAGYLFPEVARRRREYAKNHPEASIISLGVGNTTEPLPKFIAKAMADYAIGLSTAEGYSGYGDDCGTAELRRKIAETFYNGLADADEVFVADGAKKEICSLRRREFEEGDLPELFRRMDLLGITIDDIKVLYNKFQNNK